MGESFPVTQPEARAHACAASGPGPPGVYGGVRGSLALGPTDQGVGCSLRDARSRAGPSQKVFMENPRMSAEHLARQEAGLQTPGLWGFW